MIDRRRIEGLSAIDNATLVQIANTEGFNVLMDIIERQCEVAHAESLNAETDEQALVCLRREQASWRLLARVKHEIDQAITAHLTPKLPELSAEELAERHIQDPTDIAGLQ